MRTNFGSPMWAAALLSLVLGGSSQGQEGDASKPRLVVQTGHSSQVLAAGFSPDGKRIVTGSWDNTARIWDADTGKEIRQLIGHTNLLLAAVFSPDGKRIVTGSQDRTARIWDADTGKELRQLTGHAGRVKAVGFSPDGKRIVVYLRVGHLDTDWKVIIGVVVGLGSKAELFQIIHALGPRRRLTHFLDRGDKQADQYRDDRNDDQQFEKRETGSRLIETPLDGTHVRSPRNRALPAPALSERFTFNVPSRSHSSEHREQPVNPSPGPRDYLCPRSA